MRYWLAFAIILISLSQKAKAQEYLFEAGVSGGITTLIGDLSESDTKENTGIMVRYNHNLRNAIKLTIDRATIGQTSRANNLLNYQYAFKRNLIDIGIQYEYNFFSYSDTFEHMEAKRFTPYILSGIGITHAAEGGTMRSITALNIPIGVGVKYKLSTRINIGAEATFRWCSSDHLDGILNPTKGSTTWYKNNDWYTFTKIFITFDFGRRKCDCPKNN